MNFLERTHIIELNNQHEFALILYLDANYTEFAPELGAVSNSSKDIEEKAKRLINERYPGIKFTAVRVMIGGLLVMSIPFGTEKQASASTASDTVQTVQTANQANVYYQVVAGDTLWSLSKKFNTTVDQIKRANNLSSDTLSLHQRLIIPKAIHTIKSGETLYGLSKQYGVSIDAIRTANTLTTDLLQVGKNLIIPAIIDSSTQHESAAPPPEQTTPASSTNTTYTVVTGDTLWGIANRFGTNVTALKTANRLTSDSLSIGQTLIMPTSGTATPEPVPSPTPADDSPPAPTGNTFTYTVVSGDTLSAIANRYGSTVDGIRTENNLTSDMLYIGQKLVIPNAAKSPDPATQNTIDYITHTVQSGDTIWGLSVKYGIPQNELLKVNNLTSSSRLSIGQKLTVPVHNIAVKPVVSDKHGELLDWFSEAQYVFTIGETAKVTDFLTGKSFYIKRTIGANHADSETVTLNDTNIAKSIWGGFSWTPRAVIVEVDGRKLAASMSFMPHEQDYVTNNGITGHFDVYFSNSLRHVDGKPDLSHQAKVEIAAGLR